MNIVGNKALLPVFTYSSWEVGCANKPKEEVESVLVTVDGHVVDVRKIQEDMEKAEKQRLAAEANANVLKNSLSAYYNNN